LFLGSNNASLIFSAAFAAKMLARGYSVRMFDPAGQDDIGGGCGQLWFVQKWMRENGHIKQSQLGLKRALQTFLNKATND